jgi:hypothetical protein
MILNVGGLLSDMGDYYLFVEGDLANFIDESSLTGLID